MTSFLELIDNTLGTHFHTPVYDPKVGQKKLVRVIDLAAKQHKEGITRAPNRSWAVGNNNAISFAPKIDGKPVRIGGKEINYVPAERFQDFLTKLKAAVEAGDLNKEIKAAIDAPAPEAAAAGSSGGTGSIGGGRSKDPFPKHLRTDYDSLSDQEKRTLGTRWGRGKNPDNTLRSDGENPNAPIAPSSNAK